MSTLFIKDKNDYMEPPAPIVAKIRIFSFVDHARPDKAVWTCCRKSVGPASEPTETWIAPIDLYQTHDKTNGLPITTRFDHELQLLAISIYNTLKSAPGPVRFEVTLSDPNLAKQNGLLKSKLSRLVSFAKSSWREFRHEDDVARSIIEYCSTDWPILDRRMQKYNMVAECMKVILSEAMYRTSLRDEFFFSGVNPRSGDREMRDLVKTVKELAMRRADILLDRSPFGL